MIRRIAVLVCLISILPAAVGAQEFPPTATNAASTAPSGAPPREIADTAADRALLPPDLSSTAALHATLIAQNDTATAPATDSEPKKRSSCAVSLREWAEIHWGGYRWIWWAGAAAALIAIHAAQ